MTTNKKLSVAILSLSILTIMTGATIVPILGNIKNDFVGVNNIFFKLILTLPMIMLIPATFISSKLTFYFSKKSVLILGLVLYIVGGAGAGFSSSINIIMILRCLLGIGLGLIIPISTSSIADFYVDNQRLKMMGYSFAVGSLGGIISPLLSGFLASFSWRYSFGIYLVAIFVLVLVILFFQEKKSYTVYEKKNISCDVYKLAFYMFLMSIIFFALPANLSLFLSEYNIGDSKLSSILVFLLNGSSFVAGIMLSRISNYLNRFKNITSYTLMGVGFTILSYSVNSIYLGVGIILVGISVGVLTPTYMLNTTKISSENQRGYAIAIVSSSMYLGQFVSPLFSLFIQNVFDYSNVKLPFFISTILSFIIVIVNFSIISTKYRRQNNTKGFQKASINN